jgi:release factor glutamine methyltransferase
MAAPTEQWTIGRLLDTAGGYLREKGSASARLDSELLLAETLGLERIHLYTQFDRPLSAAEVDAYRGLVARRAAHEPVAYILGRAHFRHLLLEVGPTVLVPRPETEELVEAALRLLRRRPPWGVRVTDGAGPALAAAPVGVASQGAARPLVADVGTGSGAIALSLAQEAGLPVLATDTSAEALAVAARNAKMLGLEASVELVQADLLSGVPGGSLHLVVSNPPYVASGDVAALAPDVREFEPVTALEAGGDGLAVIRRLLPEAARALRPGGSVLLEVGDRQAAAVEELAREAGFSAVTTYKDLSGKDRIVEASLPGAFRLPTEGVDESTQTALACALREGAMIGVPTDTVYGLAARWDSAPGVRALFVAKGRAQEQIVAAVFASVQDVERSLPDLEPSAVKVMKALLPGPYTFVVKTEVPRAPLVGTADSLGVRVPDHPALLGIAASLGVPLAVTSANLTGEKDAATVDEVDPAVLAHCSAVFAPAAGAAAAGVPPAVTGVASTVVDLRPLACGAEPVVLREGAVSAAKALERIAAAGRRGS